MAILQNQTHKVSIIIVNYRTPELIIKLLRSLGKHDAVEIIVVDNSPTPELEEQISHFAPIRYVRNAENKGFAGGVNTGLDGARGEWIFLLNSDATTTCADVLQLISEAEEHFADVAVPKLIDDNDTVEKNIGYFDGPFTHFTNWVFARPRFIDPSDVEDPLWVDVATGGALLIHKSVFTKIGKLDDKSFFMYFEDIDFCLRLQSHGIKILFIPTIQIVHSGGKSSDQNLAIKSQNYKNSLKAYILKQRGWGIQKINNYLRVFD